MINFFRKIRRQLFTENGISKYFVYAIGEMILVIIGILIALQINNWNESRKSALLGHEMVLEIKSGIESDLTELNRFLSSQRGVLNSQSIVSNWLKAPPIETDTLAKHFSKIYITTDYTVNYAGYETLKKFGLRRIDNDSLRLSIASLYEIKYPRFIKYTDIYQKFLNELLSQNPKHFNELNYMRPQMVPLDVSELKADTKYAYHLNTLKNFNQLLIYQGSILMKEMEDTYSKF